MRPAAFSALMIAIAAAGAIAYPWGEFVGHPHWARVGWIPFVSPPVRPLDIAGNLLLCVPIGAITGWELRRGVLVGGAISLGLSLVAEVAQSYTHTRFPSATDVVCNVGGAILAAALVGRYRRARAGRRTGIDHPRKPAA